MGFQGNLTIKSSYLFANELRIHYLRWRAKEPRLPALLLHGLASNAHIWDLVAPQLATAGLDCYAPDARGHGLSDKLEDYRFETLATDLSAFLDACRLERPLLVGHSWGAMLALDYAVRYSVGPQAPRGLVLVDGGITQLDDQPDATWESISERLAPPHLAGMSLDVFLRNLREWTASWQPDESVFPILIANFVVDEADTIAPHLTYERHMRILREIWEFRTYECFKLVRCPVLMIPAIPPELRSAEDKAFLVAKERGVQLAEQSIRDLKVAWMKDTIHDIPLQRPNELAHLVLDFVSSLVI